ncbi:hypothetical protein JQR85_05795 [Stutzerimonas urumqiensis]|uniref:DUF6231 family protein n=1 Tax=Stutzerimonas urumqiensis TaxID=638269 RepID=UPI003DA4C8F8
MIDNTLSRSPQQALAALLEQQAPARLLAIGKSEMPAVRAYLQANPDCYVEQVSSVPLPSQVTRQRFDLALVADCLEHVTKRDGLELLGGIRNLNASRMAVLVDMLACDWHPTDFYALALQASEHFQRDDQVLTLFTYDLLQYKQVPDWLNARFWANPEHFGKYWW